MLISILILKAILHWNQEGVLLSSVYTQLMGIFAYRTPDWGKLATCKLFFFKENLFNEEINCITNEEETAQNELENEDPLIFFELCTVYIKN